MSESFPHLACSPVLHASVYLHPSALVIGDVTIDADTSVWCYAVLRGDVHRIRIGKKSNIQDFCMLHATTDVSPTLIGDQVTVGHHAILHGCTLEDRVLVGMGAIVLDEAVVGHDSIVGAGALITKGTRIPPGSLVLGAPAKVVRALTPAEKASLVDSADHYVALARAHSARRETR